MFEWSIKTGRNAYYVPLFFILLTNAAMLGASEPNYLSAEQPVAASVDESQGPMEDAFTAEEKRRRPLLFPNLKQRLQTASPFWRDTKLSVLPRMYSLNRTRDDASDRSAWALGGQVQYQSGWWQDRIKVGASWYTSQKLHGRKDEGGTLLLQPGQQSFSVIGEAYLEAKLTNNISTRLYRQRFDAPYVNSQDTRMLPNTFEAYTLIKESQQHGAYALSHVTKMKRQNSNEFIPISEAAGFDDTDEPLTMIGGRYSFDNDVTIGVTNQYAWEFMNTFYAEVDSTWTFDNDLALRLAGQFTKQQSVGDELDGDFNTSVYGVKAALSYNNATLTLAHTKTDEDSRIRSPFGGYPGYLSIIINDFYQADEEAWLLGASYDFSKVGAPGLSGFINYAQGNTPDSGPNASADKDELNITIDYRFQKKSLKGLWLRARAAIVDRHENSDGLTDLQDYRFIVNYEIPIL